METQQSNPIESLGKLIFAALVLVGAAANSFAEQTNTLGATDSIGNTSWNTSLNWTNHVQPGPGTNYFTGPFGLRTPGVSGNQTFAGDSLTVSPGGVVTYKGTGATVPGDVISANWVMAGGNIGNGVGGYPVIAGTMNVSAPSAITPSLAGRYFIVAATLSGSALLTNGFGAAGIIWYTNDNATAFTGPIQVDSGNTIVVGSQTNLGGNPASFNASQLILDNGIFQPATSFSLNNANSGVTLNPGGGTFTNGSGLTLTVSNIIAGVGNLTNSGAGTLLLDATNTYTGATTIAGGTLSVGGAGQLGSGTYSGNILDNATFNYASSAAQTLSGIISGSGALTDSGAGTLTLSGANTYSGATAVSAGQLNIGNWGAATPGSITVGNAATTATLNITGGTLALGANSISVGSGTSSSYIGIVNQSAGTVSFSSGNAMLLGNGSGGVGTYNLSGGTLSSFASNSRGVMIGVNNSCSGTFNLSGSGNLSLGNAELAVGRDDSASTGCTVAYNQTGGTANVGYLSIGGQSGSTTTTATFSLTGGTFAAANFQRIVAAASSSAAITLGGSAQVTLPAFPAPAGTANLTLDFTTGYLSPLASSLNYLSGLTHAYLTPNGANFNVGTGNSITLAQVFQDKTTGGTLTKTGNGTMTLSGVSTYSGATTISAGELVGLTGSSIANSTLAVTPSSGVATLGVSYTGGNSQWSCSNLTLNAGGTGVGLEFAFGTAPSTTTSPLNVISNATFNVTPTVTVDVGNVVAGTYPLVTVGGTAPVAVPANVTWFPAARQGTLSGTLAWGGSGFGSKTLVLTVTGSSVEPLNWGSSGSGTWDVNDATNIVWNDSASPTPGTTYYQQSMIAGDSVVFGDTYVTANTTVTLNTNISPASVTFNNSTYNYTNNGTGGIVGPITLTKNGSAAVTLSTPNTYTGGTIINQGVVNTGVAGGLGASAVTIGGAGTLNLTAAGVTYTGPNTGISGAGTLNITTGSGSSSTPLNGSNSGFTGMLNVGTNSSGGKVQLNGALSSSATVNILSNSTVYLGAAISQPAAAILYGGTPGETYGQLRVELGGNWSGPVTLAGPIIGSGVGTIGAVTGAGSISGNIGQTGGAQSLIMINGTMTLSGTNTYTGPTIVNGGNLTLLGNQTGANGGYYVGTNANGVTLNIGSATQTNVTLASVAATNIVTTHSAGTAYSTINIYGTNGLPTYVTNNGTLSIGRDSGFQVNGYASWLQSGPMTVQANGGYPGNFTVVTNGTFTYTGYSLITNSAPVSSGNASMSVSGTFTTGQGFYFNDSGSSGYPLFTLASGGTLALSTNISQLVVAGGSGPVGQFLLAPNATINLGGFSTTLGFVVGNVSGQAGSLVVNGGGKLSLGAKNTYSGATTINDCELVGVTGGSCSNSSVSVTPVAAVSTLGVLYAGGNSQWACSNVTFNVGGTGAGLEFAFNTTPSTTIAPLSVISNAVFNVTPAVTVDVGNVVAGSYPLMVVGGPAPTAVPALTLSPAGRLGTLAGSLAWGGSGFATNTLVLTVTGSSVEPLSWNSGGSGSGTWDINDSGNLIWNDSSATSTYYQQSVSGDQVVFDDVGTDITTPTIVTLNSIVTPASVTVNNSTYAYAISGSGAIAGATSLNKSGASTLTFSNVNTYTGPTVINAGTLALGGAGALGNGNYTAAITDNGALIDGSSASQILSGTISGSGTLTQQGPGALFLAGSNSYSGGTYLYGGTLELDSTNGAGTGPILDTTSLILNVAGTVTNVITGTGSLVKNGTGTTLVKAGNSFSGGTTINAGILQTGTTNALGSPLNSGVLLANISSGASLDCAGQQVSYYYPGNYVLASGPGFSASQGAVFTSAGMSCQIGCAPVGIINLRLAANTSIGDSSGDFQIGPSQNANSGNGLGSIDGQGFTLTKIGNNVVVLDCTNASALSSFVVAGGGVVYPVNNPFGSTAALVISNNAWMDTWDNINNSGWTVPNNITIGIGGGQLRNTRGGFYGHADYNTFPGTVTLNGNLVVANTTTFNGAPANVATSGTMTFSGAISGTGGILCSNGPVNVSGSTSSLNTETLSGANTYTGETLVNQGELFLSTIQQGGGTYTNTDGSILDVPPQTGYVTVPMSVLALGSSTGAVLSLSRFATFSSSQAPITATNLTFTGTSVIQLPNVAYTLSGQFPLIQYVTGTNGTGGLALALPASIRGISAFISNNVANKSFDLVVNGNNAVTWTGNASANWDITNSINWKTNGVATTYYQPTNPPGDAVLFNDTSSVTNVNLTMGVSPFVVTVNNTNNNYSLGGSPITNTTALIKTGIGTLTVSNANTFTGGTFISGGTIKLGNNAAFNNSSGTVNVSGNGALDFNNYQPTTLACTISGTGFNGLGTLVQNSGNNNAYGPASVTLAGSATIGGTNRWDLRNGANTLNCPTNAYALTKVGAGLMALVGTTVSTNLGDINILGGSFGYQVGTTGLGNPTNALRIGNGGTLEFYAATVPLSKNIICSNGASFLVDSGSGSQNIIVGPVSVVTGATVSFNASSGSLIFSTPISITNGTLSATGGTPYFLGGLSNINGTVTMTGSSVIGGPVNIPSGSTLQFNGNYYNTLTFSNVLSGSGSFGIQYQSYVKLAASNTFSGNITIPQCNSGSGNVLYLIGNGSISAVPTITMQGIASGQASPSHLDVSGRVDGTLTLFPNQTLQVDNGCQVISNLVVGSGATLKMAGFNYFTNVDRFFVTGNLTNQPGSTNILWVNGNTANPTNVSVYVTGSLAYGGTLVIYTNGVGYMQPGASFKLFNAASYSGSFSSIVPPTPGPGLVWDTTQLATSGTLFVGMIPTNSVTPSPATVTYGNNVSLTANAGGTVPLAYQWYFNSLSSPISWATTSSITLTNPAVAASGSYFVVVTNTYGSATNQVTLTVNRASLIVAANSTNRAYGASNPAFTASYSGFVNGDTAGSALTGTPSLTSSATAASPVGAYSITTANGTLSSANYSFSDVNGTLTINTAGLTITASAQSKIYGATLPLGTTAFTTSGLNSGDTVTGVTLTSAGAAGIATIGSYSIAATNAVGSGLTNYSITYNSGSLTVSPLPVLLAGTRAYDGTTNASGTNLTILNIVGGDGVSLSGVGGLDSANIGTNTITSFDTLALDSNTGTNYTLAGATGAMVITNAPLAITANDDGKTYDGNAYGTNNGVTYAGFVNGETSAVLGGTLAYGGTSQGAVNAGSYTIVPSGLTSTNYAISYLNGTLTVNPLAIAVTADAQTKVYGSADPALTYTYAPALIGSDSFGGTLSRASGEGVGSYAINQGSLSLSANYSLNYTGANLTITPASLTVTANSTSKVYGQTVTFAGTEFTTSGLQFSDTVTGVTLNSDGATNTAGVGSYPIAVSAATGSGLGNYNLSYVNGSLTVSPATLGVTADNQSRLYGATNPVFTASYSGFVNGDTSAVISGSPLLTTTADTNSPVGAYTITAALGSLTATNYTFSLTNGTLTVAAAAITVTADNQSQNYGDPTPALTYTYSGFVNGDTAAVFSGTPTLNTGTSTNSPVGSYVITNNLGSLIATNYAFTLVSGTLIINPASLTVTANDDGKTYDGNAYGTNNGVTYAGFVNGETSAVLGGTLAYGGTSQGAFNAGSYTIVPSGLTSTNYAISYLNGTLTVNPLAIAVTADTQTKVYGSADPALTYTYAPALIGGDSFGGTLSRASGEGVGSYAINQGSLSLSANYSLNYTGTNLTITPANLTVTANSTSKVYGQTVTFAGTEFTTSGLQFSDTVTGVTLNSDGATNTAGVGSYPIAVSAATGSGLGNYNLSYVNGSLTVSAATPVTLLTPVVLGDGTIQLNFSGGDSSVNYEIQATDDPVNGSWMTLSNIMSGGGGITSFVDTDSTNYIHRFYRTVSP